MKQICSMILQFCNTKNNTVHKNTTSSQLDRRPSSITNFTCTLHRWHVTRANKFVPQHMRVFDQAIHSIFSICTCSNQVIVFYDTPSLVNFCSFPSNNFFCVHKKVDQQINKHFMWHLVDRCKGLYRCSKFIFFMFTRLLLKFVLSMDLAQNLLCIYIV